MAKRRPISNLEYPVPDDQIDVEFEFDGARGDWGDEMEWASAEILPLPDRYRIHRSEWGDRINELEKTQTSNDFYCDTHSHQGRSHECVWHSICHQFNCAWNKQYGSTKYSIWFAPVHGYTRATGGRQYGGSNVQESLRRCMSQGLVPEHDGPEGKLSQFKRFAYTCHQTSGRTEDHWPTSGWIRPGNFDQPESDETQKHFRVLEAYYVPDREAHASALLNPEFNGVGNGRKGHAIWQQKMVRREGTSQFLSMYRDSYEVFRFDSESLWSSGGYTIRAVTMPHDPQRPAGDQMKG